VGCKVMFPLRTKLWHDPLVQVWHMLARMAGLSCGSAARKNEAWLSHTRPQGDTFIPICSEVGGRQGAQANDLLDKTFMSAGGSLSDRTAFTVYALERLHAATFRGVAAVISARPIWCTGPGIFLGQAVSPRGPASQRPTINFSSHGCFVPRVFTNIIHMMARDTPGT